MTDTSVHPSESSVNALADQLRTVAVRRDIYAIAKGIMDNRRRAFEIANGSAILEVESARTQMASAEMEARDLALAVYAETGSKQPHPGVGIRETTVYSYSPAKCLEWVIEHKHTELLKLDDTAFKKVAGVLKAPTFMVRKEPTATIAADLTKALGIEPVAGGLSE